MSHDVVLVQTWVPVTSDVVQSDLNVEDQKHLVVVRQECQDKLRELVRSCSCQDAPKEQLEHVSRAQIRTMDIIPSPRTALMRPVATMASEERNFILVADVQVFEDCRSWSC